MYFIYIVCVLFLNIVKVLCYISCIFLRIKFLFVCLFYVWNSKRYYIKNVCLENFSNFYSIREKLIFFLWII